MYNILRCVQNITMEVILLLNQEIKCSVDNCSYNNHGSKCTLGDITVSKTCGEPGEPCETQCSSFHCE